MAGRLITRKDERITATDLVEQFGRVVVVVGDREVTIPKVGEVEIVTPEQNNDAGAVPSSVTPGSYSIGQLVEGKGIYQGSIVLPNKFDIELPEMDLWAAPQDLKEQTGGLLKYKDTVPVVAGLENWHGRDGAPLEDRPSGAQNVSYEEALYRYFDALAKGDIKGTPGWVIPTKEMLHGREVGSGDITVPNNLYAHRNAMPDGSGLVTQYSGTGNANWYWSCTEYPDGPSGVYGVDFTDGNAAWGRKANDRLSTRPVSAELRL